MEHRLSMGGGGYAGKIPSESGTDPGVAYSGNAINYPSNPRFRSSVAFKSTLTSDAMEERKTMLESHALIVKEEGALGLASCEELKGGNLPALWHTQT
jgi:hypothetical protein